MELLVRSIPHDAVEYAMGQCLFWPAINTDAISCTFNMDGFTPMRAVLSALGRDRGHFDSPEITRRHAAGFCAMGHDGPGPLLITASKTPTWDSSPQATLEIINVADTERCQSLCMTHFAYVCGDFPCIAFQHCLHLTLEFSRGTSLKKIVVDIDERYAQEAGKALENVLTQHRYAARHNITAHHLVRHAEGGAPDQQAELAAHLLTRSAAQDRAVEALKWLMLATLIRGPDSSDKQLPDFRGTMQLIYGAMSEEDATRAYQLADAWLAGKMSGLNADSDVAPEFHDLARTRR